MNKSQISVFMLTALALASCSAQPTPGPSIILPNNGQQNIQNTIFGIVKLDGPVLNANVQAFDAAGAMIGTAKTDESGGFTIDTITPPENYTIIVKGGMSNGTPMDGVLRSDIGPGIKIISRVGVNPATTLVSLTRKRNAMLSLSEATEKVRRFLDIPQGIDLGWDFKQSQFSGKKFLEEAKSLGGQDAFFSILMSQMDSGQTHSFLSPVFQSGIGDAVSFATEGIANGFFGSAGSAVFGGFMSLIGLGGNPDKAALEAAQQEMAKLNQLSTKLDDLDKHISTIEANLSKSINQSTYIGLSSGKAATYVSYNRTIEQKISDISSFKGTVDKRKALMDDLNQYIKDNLVQNEIMIEWDIVMAGSSLGNVNDGLIVNWSKLVAQTDLTQYGAQQAQDIQNQWDYYQGQQAQSMIYLVNYYKYNNFQDDYILSKLNQWQQLRIHQLGVLKGNLNAFDHFYLPGSAGSTAPVDIATRVAALPQDTVVDRTNKTMWTTQPVFSGTIRSVADNNSGILNFEEIAGQKSADLKSKTQLDGWVLPDPPERTLSHIRDGNPLFDNKKAIFVPSANYGKEMHKLNIDFKDSDRILYNEVPLLRKVMLKLDSMSSNFSKADKDQISELLAFWDRHCNVSPDKYTPLIMNIDHGQYIINDIKNQGYNNYNAPDAYCVRIFDDGFLNTYEQAISGEYQTEGQFLEKEVKIFLKRTAEETYWYEN